MKGDTLSGRSGSEHRNLPVLPVVCVEKPIRTKLAYMWVSVKQEELNSRAEHDF